MAQIKDDSYLMGFRAAMMITYRGIDSVLEDNKLINNDKFEDRTPQKRVLTKKVIATLKDMGNKAVLLHDKNIKTMARVWVSNEYGVKVADPFDRNRHYNRVLNDFTMLEEENELISLASAAKRVYLTTFVLKSRIEKGYYSLTSDDIIVKNKSSRKYMYLPKNKVDKIIKFEIDKALELVNDFRAHGWKFEYDKVDRVTYTPYVFPPNSDQPLNLIADSWNSVDELWLYVAHVIRFNKIDYTTRVDLNGKIVR